MDIDKDNYIGVIAHDKQDVQAYVDEHYKNRATTIYPESIFLNIQNNYSGELIKEVSLIENSD